MPRIAEFTTPEFEGITASIRAVYRRKCVFVQSGCLLVLARTSGIKLSVCDEGEDMVDHMV